MSAHIVFENSGEIDPLMICTFGVNVKESDSAIGFFGTGLKYAIAILCRMEIPIQIQSGETVHHFSKSPKNLRGKDFDFIAMNGQPMGFTAEVGKNWKLWMAYREIYCNAQDEGGRVYESDEIPAPQAGMTRVIVSGEAFADVRRQHSTYFLTTEPFLTSGKLEVHRGKSCHVYYKQVAVGQVSESHALFTYNITKGIELTEDRTLKAPHAYKHEIACAITQCHDRELIKQIILASDHFMEHELDLDQYVAPSAEFLEVCEELLRINIAGMNRTARAAYERHTQKQWNPKPHEMDVVERKQMERATAFSKKSGFDIDKFPMLVVEAIGSNTFAMAREGKIYVAKNCFAKGTKFLAATLIEEFLHLEYGFDDCTRDMQNHLFDLVVTFGERLLGEPV